MPYENEHAARLKNPKDFDPKSFRRTNGGTIYGSKKVPKTIAIIWAKLKGKSKPSDPPIPQSLRFPTKSWTVQKAKKWLKDNNVKYQSFEPAEKKKSKASYAKEQTKKKYTCECIKCGHILETDKHCKDIKCSKCGGQMRRKERPGPGQSANKKEKQSMSEDTAPTNACIFNDNAVVTFAKGDDDKKSNNFRIVGYTGVVMKDHWFWGNVAFDLEGMKFAKKRTPVLAEHFRDVRIGFTTKQDIKDQVIVEGPFLDNDDAQKLKADMEKGFPMEASLLVPPLIVEHVKEGESVKVNGNTLKGPGTVFRKSTIMEVSMCVFGFDSNTKSSAYADSDNQKIKFNLIQENTIMNGTEETQTVTEIESVESFAELYPEFHKEIRAEGMSEGKKEERALFAALKDACGDDHELLVQCFSENKTAAEAMKLRVEKIEKEKTQLTEKVTELQKKKPAVEAARTEFTDEATPPGKQTETGSADEAALKAEFAASADLQAEYGGDVDAYIAFKKADTAGRVRIAGQTRT